MSASASASASAEPAFTQAQVVDQIMRYGGRLCIIQSRFPYVWLLTLSGEMMVVRHAPDNSAFNNVRTPCPPDRPAVYKEGLKRVASFTSLHQMMRLLLSERIMPHTAPCIKDTPDDSKLMALVAVAAN
jgi:hypothetical protein